MVPKGILFLAGLLLPASLAAQAYVAVNRESGFEAEPRRLSPVPPPLVLKAMAVQAPAADSAGVLVHVQGVRLVDPKTTSAPSADQGHLHFHIDNGPLVETSATNVVFSGLAPGRHTVSVALASNDHSPLGPAETLVIRIP